MNLSFEILFDADLLGYLDSKDRADLKRLLSIANDFEEGKWRLKHFEAFIWDNLAETALSQRERDSLIDHSFSTLVQAASNLRLTDSEKDPGKGSEIAEILLYGVMRRHYGALPIVPKIFYKQNSNDNAKGADSVHIVIDEDGNFTLWLGESKFYSNIEDSFPKIIGSIRSTLTSEKIRKENSLILNAEDLELIVPSKEIVSAIRADLSHLTSIDKIKKKLHIPILILYQCELTAETSDLDEDYRNEVIAEQRGKASDFFRKQFSEISSQVHSYDQIHFHLILFPVPDKKILVDRFTERARSLR